MILNDFQWLNLVQTLLFHHKDHKDRNIPQWKYMETTWRLRSLSLSLTCDLCLCDELLPTWAQYCLSGSAAERHGGLPRSRSIGRCSELTTTKSSAGLCGITWISCGSRVDLMSWRLKLALMASSFLRHEVKRFLFSLLLDHSLNTRIGSYNPQPKAPIHWRRTDDYSIPNEVRHLKTM